MPENQENQQIKKKEDLEAHERFGMRIDDNNKNNEPNIAPGMNTHDDLEEKATAEEIERGDRTMVTRLYLDRTPED